MMASFSDDGSGNKTANTDADALASVGENDNLLSNLTKKEIDNKSNSVNKTHARDHSFLGTIAEGVEYISETADVLIGKTQEAADVFIESAQEVAESAQEAAGEIRDAIVEEVNDIKETLVDNLVEKDDGDSVIFEMGLTRNLSILPSDIEEVAFPKTSENTDPEAGHVTILSEVKQDLNCCPERLQKCCRPSEKTKQLADSLPSKSVDSEGAPLLVVDKRPKRPMDRSTSFHAYLTLFTAVVCLSSIGPSLDMQGGVTSAMKIYWRMTGTYIALLPMALRSVMVMGVPRLTGTQWCTFLLAAFCYATMCVCFVLALNFTSVGNAVIFANSQAILLLIGKGMVGQSVLFVEGAGALVAFAGAVACASDSSATTGNVFSTDLDGPVVWAGWGDLLALLSAIGGVGYLIFAKTLREHVPSVFAFMFMIMFAGSNFVLAFLWLSGTDFTFNRDIHHGLWGWMNLQLDRLPLEIWMVVVCNLCGSMGYVRAMQHFDNLIDSVATLMEPVVASLMAFFLGVGLLPNALGWLGNILVMVGTVAVIYPSSKSGKDTGSGH